MNQNKLIKIKRQCNRLWKFSKFYHQTRRHNQINFTQIQNLQTFNNLDQQRFKRNLHLTLLLFPLKTSIQLNFLRLTGSSQRTFLRTLAGKEGSETVLFSLAAILDEPTVS